VQHQWISEMFWSEIAKRFGPLSSEVGYGLCTLVTNNFHHVKCLKELFVVVIIIYHRRTGTFGLKGEMIFLPEKFM